VFGHWHEFKIGRADIGNENAGRVFGFEVFAHFVSEIIVYYRDLAGFFDLEGVRVDQDEFVRREELGKIRDVVSGSRSSVDYCFNVVSVILDEK
jgi:hypothetical protein